MLNRLEKKQEAMLKTTLEPAAFTANVKHTSTCSRLEHNINWEICIFCQKKEGKNLRNAMTMALSDKILFMAEGDVVMRVRLANVSDLVAAEGKYHVQCWVRLQRNIDASSLKTGGNKKRDECLDIYFAQIF